MATRASDAIPDGQNLARRDDQSGLPGAGNDVNTKDGVPAQLKEVIMNAYPRHTQDAGPDLRQRHFLGRSRWGEIRDWSCSAADSGRAAASSFPLVVRGNFSTKTNAAGTM